jgi:hypothetical protein
MESAASERPIPIGRTGAVEALALSHSDDNAILVRQAGQPRALLTADASGHNERLVVTPLDDDVEIRVDGDALAVWIGSAPITPTAARSVPAWASGIGLILLLLFIGFALIGSVVVFDWLARAWR